MANLSQEKRKRMLEFLQQIRAEHTDDLSIIAINEIESELTSKKYGLVWEEHTEEVDEQIKHNVPVFTEVSDKIITSDETLPYNFLLEGDNLHSLKLLEKTHKGKIDVIYIDPPYNTGNKDFIYNDIFVGVDDGFRHSKWLSFMEKRITSAKNLLSENGIILLSINDNECSNLKLLCDTIFGSENFVENFIWIKNSGGSLSKTTLTRHEYVLCYAKNIELSYNMPFYYMEKPGYKEVVSLISNCKKKGLSIEQARKILTKFYNDHPELKGISLYSNIDENWQVYRTLPITAPNNQFYDVLHPITKKPVKTPPRGWSWSEETMLKNIASGKVVFGKDETYGISQKLYLEEAKFEHKRSTFMCDQAEGNKTLQSVLGTTNTFNNPKPISLLNYLFQNTPNDITILDFFAGSGTTAQAVMELNKQDGGNRRFILCANNENGICENITYQRIKTIITGKRADGSEYGEGISANLKYFKTDYIAKTSEDEEYSVGDKLLEHIAEMVELQHGTKIDNEKHILVLTDEMADGLTEEKLANCEQLYVSVSVLLTTEQERMFKRMGVEVLTIPDYYFESELLEVGER